MKKTVLFFAITILIFLVITDSKKSKTKKTKEKIDYVIHLNNTNYNDYVKEKDSFLVNFVASKSKECKQFSPKFRKASRESMKRNMTFTFVQVDGIQNNEIAKQFNMTHYPSVYYVNVKDNIIMLYNEEYSYQGLMKFLKRVSNWTVNEINSLNDIESTLSRKRKNILLFAGDKDVFSKQFNTITKNYDTLRGYSLFHSKNPELIKSYGINQFDAIIFKPAKDSTNKKKRILGAGVRLHLPVGLTKDIFLTHLNIYKRPSVANFNDETTLHSLLDENINSLIFVGNNSTIPEINEVTGKLADKYRHEFWFINASLSDEHHTEFFKLMNIKSENLPMMLILIHKTNLVDDIHKFKSQGPTPITVHEVESFIQDWRNNKLQRFLASEDEPKKTVGDLGIHTLVTNTLLKAVSDFSKDILLLFCTKLSKRCERMSFVFEIIARKLNNNPTLLFAEIDPTKNELPYFEIKDVPQLVFFPANPNLNSVQNRLSSGIDYNGNFTFNDVIEFINKNSQTPITVLVLDREEKILKQEAKNPVIKVGKLDLDLSEISGIGRQKLLGEREEEIEDDDDEGDDHDDEDEEKIEKYKKKKPSHDDL